MSTNFLLISCFFADSQSAVGSADAPIAEPAAPADQATATVAGRHCPASPIDEQRQRPRKTVIVQPGAPDVGADHQNQTADHQFAGKRKFQTRNPLKISSFPDLTIRILLAEPNRSSASRLRKTRPAGATDRFLQQARAQHPAPGLLRPLAQGYSQRKRTTNYCQILNFLFEIQLFIRISRFRQFSELEH